MIDLQDINLDHARSVYMTANTPMYIIRNLRSDSQIMKICRQNSGEDILREIRDRLERLPLDFEDRVLPIALLVALSLKQNRDFMVEASLVNGRNCRWYRAVVDYLVQQVRPTSRLNFISNSTAALKPVVLSHSTSSFNVIEVS